MVVRLRSSDRKSVHILWSAAKHYLPRAAGVGTGVADAAEATAARCAAAAAFA